MRAMLRRFWERVRPRDGKPGECGADGDFPCVHPRCCQPGWEHEGKYGPNWASGRCFKMRDWSKPQ